MAKHGSRSDLSSVAGVVAVLVLLFATLPVATPTQLPMARPSAAIHVRPAASYFGNVSVYGSEVERCWSGATRWVNSCSESVPVIHGSTVVLFAYEGSSVYGSPAVGQTFSFSATFDSASVTKVGTTQAPGLGTCQSGCTSTGFGLAVTAFVVPFFRSTGTFTAELTWTNITGTGTVVWLDAVVLEGIEPVAEVDAVSVNSTTAATAQARVDLTSTGYGGLLVMGALGYDPTVQSASTAINGNPLLNQGALGSASYSLNDTTRCDYCSAASIIAQPFTAHPGGYGVAGNFTTGTHHTSSTDKWTAIALVLNETQPPTHVVVTINPAGTILLLNWTASASADVLNYTIYYAGSPIEDRGCSNLGNNVSSAGTGSPSLPYRIAGLTPSSLSYCVVVEAWTAAGISVAFLEENATIRVPEVGLGGSGWSLSEFFLFLFLLLIVAIVLTVSWDAQRRSNPNRRRRARR